jgi:hypothetical protein
MGESVVFTYQATMKVAKKEKEKEKEKIRKQSMLFM